MSNFKTNQAKPTLDVTINKNRLKKYKKKSDTPVYYLEDGQEFQLELFNPLQETVVAKIYLNDKVISQGGLILYPGKRIFLERYLDVAKKFRFKTYDVSTSDEVKKAIENNGDVKVEFYKEKEPIIPISTFQTDTVYYYNTDGSIKFDGGTGTGTYGGVLNTGNYVGTTHTSNLSTHTSYVPMNNEPKLPNLDLKDGTTSKKSKSIETGRVEKGLESSQELTSVDMEIEFFPFHIIEYKILPVSTKMNTVKEINVKRYCGNCGTKQKKGHNFCPNCGNKL